MNPTRRTMMKGALAASVVTTLSQTELFARDLMPLTKPIPSSGEALSVIGLGSWITFNVGNDKQLQNESAAVIAAFVEAGGQMIDSSPMYGSSQSTIGFGLKKVGYPERLFSADKVWISNAKIGPAQIERSRNFWGVPSFDLLQVHNLVSWEAHLDTLQDMKAQGSLRYVGITTSHGRQHKELEHVMRNHQIDFVQLTYNIIDRDAEARLLPVARDNGIAVIVNRPFQRGALIKKLARNPLPSWTSETGASSWSQFLLKFIVSHPAVNCAIPATTRVDHVRENLAAGSGRFPNEKLRQKMVDYVRQI